MNSALGRVGARAYVGLMDMGHKILVTPKSKAARGIAKASRALGVSRKAIYRLIAQGLIATDDRGRIRTDALPHHKGRHHARL